MAQDIPNLDRDIEKMPTDMRESLADMGRSNLMFFAKGVLQYRDMTDKCHGPLCAFIDKNKSQFKLMLMPRDHYKTSVVTISANMQKAVRDPEERILIRNESATNSERFLRSIRQHCEGNRVFRALYSDCLPKDTKKVRWNDQELDFRRESFKPEPTFDTIGMTGASTSRHYTHITDDDPISEEAVKSDKVMKDAIQRLSTITNLLQNPSVHTHWYVGTVWAFWDTVSWYRQSFGPMMSEFARSVTEDGEIIFPELISPEMLAMKRRVLGDYKFSCLMMNNPRNSDVQDLNVDDVRYYRWTADDRIVLLDKENLEVDTWRLDQLDITVTVDPAPAETVNSDRNAVVTCGISPRNQVIVLDVFAKRCSPYAVIEHLIALHLMFHPRVYGVEGVAYQKVFKYVLAREAERLGIYLRIQELKAPGNKKQHVRGIQPIMRLGKLYIDATQQLLLQEMSEFPLGKHDDTVDALGLQQQLWKGRLSPEHLERVEMEARKLASRISGYGLKHDPGIATDILGLMRADSPDLEIEPQVNWDEVAIVQH